jgi:outer membrane lipoprotein-sorting protein
MLIHLKGCYTLLGKIVSDSKDHRLKFSVPLENKPPVIVEIIPTENSVDSFHEFEVSKEMWDILQTNLYNGGDLPTNLQTELSEMTSNISLATRKVLNLIKYCFNQTDLNENLFSVRGYYWSID